MTACWCLIALAASAPEPTTNLPVATYQALGLHHGIAMAGNLGGTYVSVEVEGAHITPIAGDTPTFMIDGQVFEMALVWANGQSLRDFVGEQMSSARQAFAAPIEATLQREHVPSPLSWFYWEHPIPESARVPYTHRLYYVAQHQGATIILGSVRRAEDELPILRDRLRQAVLSVTLHAQPVTAEHLAAKLPQGTPLELLNMPRERQPGAASIDTPSNPD